LDQQEVLDYLEPKVTKGLLDRSDLLVVRVSQELQAYKDKQERQERKETKATQELQAYPALLDQQDKPEHQAYQGHQSLGHQALKVNPGILDPEEHQLLDHRDRPDLLDPLVKTAPLVLWVLKATPGQLGRLVRRALKENLVPQDQKDLKGVKEMMDPKENRVLQAHQELRASTEQRGRLGQ